MKIVIVGASGNVGTALLRRLASGSARHEIVGVVRRPPAADAGHPYDGVEWVEADVALPESTLTLTHAFRGADAVVHLAWMISPSHDRVALRRVNVDGTRHMLDALVAAGVPQLVYASSVGAYSPGPKDRLVGEEWPTHGVRTCSYSADKSDVERMLDDLGTQHPTLRIARLRPGLIFQEGAASAISRYFLGPFVPTRLARLLPILPMPPRMRFQAVHADDVADAYVRVIEQHATGAFNIAADPVIGPPELSRVLHARHVPVPGLLLRTLASITWRLRLQPTEPGWVDLAAAAPLLSTDRARRELGWTARRDALSAVDELVTGLVRHAGTASPVLTSRRTVSHRTP
jgi:nucleoside-diphosphate-sugar epimerase